MFPIALTVLGIRKLRHSTSFGSERVKKDYELQILVIKIAQQ